MVLWRRRNWFLKHRYISSIHEAAGLLEDQRLPELQTRAWILLALGLFSSFHCSLTAGTKEVELNVDLYFKSSLLHIFVPTFVLSWKLGWMREFYSACFCNTWRKPMDVSLRKEIIKNQPLWNAGFFSGFIPFLETIFSCYPKTFPGVVSPWKLLLEIVHGKCWPAKMGTCH